MCQRDVPYVNSLFLIASLMDKLSGIHGQLCVKNVMQLEGSVSVTAKVSFIVEEKMGDFLKMHNNKVIRLDENLFVEIPVKLNQEKRLAKINWIQLLEDPFYVAGLSIIEENSMDSYKGSYTEWILQQDDEVGFKPVCCNLYWDAEVLERVDDGNIKNCLP